MENNLPGPELPHEPEHTYEPSNKLLWILGSISGLVVFFIIGLIIMNDHPHLIQTVVNSTKTNLSTGANPFGLTANNNAKQTEKAIAKVGNEYIYKQDLDFEMKYAPGNAQDKEKNLKKKLIQDSIILQGAEADKLITLDSSVYNSPNKNYTNRLDLVRKVESLVDTKSGKISGTVITIWFFNNDTYGSLGSEQSKPYAFQKANEYYQMVLTNQLTINQALAKVQIDTSLDQLGEHKNNAGYTFDLTEGEKASFDDNFNKIIRQTGSGKLTPVTLISDKNVPGGKPIDALYAFAYVRSNTIGNGLSGYDNWLKSKINNYAVTNF